MPAKPTAKAVSLHIGLNSVSAAAYEGWTGPLAACEYDAKDMAAIAKAGGMKPTILLTRSATRTKTLAAMRAAAKGLKSGDFFFLTFSGHGGQITDIDNEEADKKDETWCLYDAQLIDDELYYELSRFAAGVRILVLSDSCHSGTVTRDMPLPEAPRGQRPKNMPNVVAARVYRAHKKFYDDLQKDVAKAAGKSFVDPDEALANVGAASHATALVGRFRPAVVLISGCQDNQTSMDGDYNGAFTGQLLRVWNDGLFRGNYKTFHAKIRAGLPASQSPNLFTLGSASAFLTQKPFTV